MRLSVLQELYNKLQSECPELQGKVAQCKEKYAALEKLQVRACGAVGRQSIDAADMCLTVSRRLEQALLASDWLKKYAAAWPRPHVKHTHKRFAEMRAGQHS